MKNTKVVIMRDQDTFNDCRRLKQRLIESCGFTAVSYPKDRILVRIPCRELESWYFGDLETTGERLNIHLDTKNLRKKYGNPDKIMAANELSKLTNKGKTKMAKLVDGDLSIEGNTSHSFNVFVSGLKSFLAE
jgi:hypothetical protein